MNDRGTKMTNDRAERSRRTIVFLGPTLPWQEADRILPADYQPPARMGDIYRLLSERVERIIIIDGVFHGVPSVWHREILEALTEGIEVIGASSMGALRAAEMHEAGMRGIGEIFTWYRDGIIDGDDEVALVHGDQESSYRPMSTPLVNLRATFFKLVAQGLVSSADAHAAIAALKAKGYPDRSLQALDPSLRSLATTHFVDLKQLDAVAALQYAAHHPPQQPRTTLPDAKRSERAMWQIGRSLRGTVPGSEPITGQALVARLDEDERRALETSLAKRTFLVAYAEMEGLQPPTTTSELPSPAWLDANGLTLAAYERLNRRRDIAEWLCGEGRPERFLAAWAERHGIANGTPDVAGWLIEMGPAHFGLPFFAEAAIADELRLTGRAAELVSRLPAPGSRRES